MSELQFGSTVPETPEAAASSPSAEPTASATPVETAEQKVARLEREFGEFRQSSTQQPAVNPLMADPEIAAIVAARSRGEKVKVVPDAPAEAREEPEEPVDWDTLTPSQSAAKLAELNAKQAKKIAAEARKPLEQKLAQVESYLVQQQTEKLAASVNTVRAKYPDFDNYRQQMVQLNAQFNGAVGPEDLYLLARARNGKPAPAEERRTTESERPTHSAARPPERATPRGVNERAIGRLAFEAALDAAVSKVPVPTLAG